MCKRRHLDQGACVAGGSRAMECALWWRHWDRGMRKMNKSCVEKWDGGQDEWSE
jgi:hypothetical protein